MTGTSDSAEKAEGFTLIEILIVVVILSIIASIVVIGVMNLSTTSANATCRADLHTVESAVQAYRAQMGNFPDGGVTGGTGIQTDTDATTVNAAASLTGPGSELLQPSSATATDPNVSISPQVGPWLRDVPSNGSHYTIAVANDGSGSITVSDAGGPTQPNCTGVT